MLNKTSKQRAEPKFINYYYPCVPPVSLSLPPSKGKILVIRSLQT